MTNRKQLSLKIDGLSLGLEAACDRDVAQLALVGPERKYYQNLGNSVRTLFTRPRIFSSPDRPLYAIYLAQSAVRGTQAFVSA
jgi:hypothetical protein